MSYLYGGNLTLRGSTLHQNDARYSKRPSFSTELGARTAMCSSLHKLPGGKNRKSAHNAQRIRVVCLALFQKPVQRLLVTRGRTNGRQNVSADWAIFRPGGRRPFVVVDGKTGARGRCCADLISRFGSRFSCARLLVSADAVLRPGPIVGHPSIDLSHYAR